MLTKVCVRISIKKQTPNPNPSPLLFLKSKINTQHGSAVMCLQCLNSSVDEEKLWPLQLFVHEVFLIYLLLHAEFGNKVLHINLYSCYFLFTYFYV